MRVVRRLVVAVLVLGLLVGAAGLAVSAVMVSRLERVDGAFDDLDDRPPEAAGSTLLMVGTRPGTDAGPDLPWLAGDQSVEAVMLVEVAPDGQSVRVDSLPRASGAATASALRASDAVAATESWSGRRVDHLVAIDWRTFVRLAEDNGVDPTYAWGSGARTQHEFLRQVMDGTLHQELRKSPGDLWQALRTTVDGTAVDDDWTVIGMDRFMFSLRDLRSRHITYGMASPG